MVAMPGLWKHPRTGIWYFRRAVPADLRGTLGREIKVSLHTRSPSEAKRCFSAELEKSETLFERARSGPHCPRRTHRPWPASGSLAPLKRTRGPAGSAARR